MRVKFDAAPLLRNGRTAIKGVTRWNRGALLKTLVFVVLATFLLLQLYAISLTNREWHARSSANEKLNSLVPQELHRFLKDRKNVTGEKNATNGTQLENEISEIRKHIERINEEQRIYNNESFGPLVPDAPVIVVQVNTRLIYLKHLIVSLSQATGINQSLVIFSHDVWNPDINYLVQSIDFARAMQIFYPHSIQTHPRSFPGEDPNDCPRDMRKHQALKRKCINAEHPDSYGHYREAKYTQIKHHWWWKANRVFDQLLVTRNHTGPLVFLEEDHYVAEDFLHVLKLMQRTCERCGVDIFSLGAHDKTYNYHGDFGITAEVMPWNHNMGMAFGRTTWSKIKSCSEEFCTYDDYNWDWSLRYIAQTCLLPKKSVKPISRFSGLVVMVIKAPRVFHIGACGTHNKKNNCEPTSVIAKVQEILKSAHDHLYPKRLVLSVTNTTKKTTFQKNGGWSDTRDINLCRSIVTNADLRLP